MKSLAVKLGVGAVALLLAGGAVAGYLEYREVADQVKPLRETNEAMKERGAALEAALADMEERWKDSVAELNRRRDSLQAAGRAAAEDRKRAARASGAASDSLEGSLQALYRRARAAVKPLADSALVQFGRLRRRHRAERDACRRQVASLRGLLENQTARTSHCRAVRDSALELAETRLERALAAERERDVWKNKAQWDLLSDGPRALLYGLGGYAAGKGVELLTGG